MNTGEKQMKKLDIHTYFTAEQMGEVLKAARRDMRSLVKHIKKKYPTDRQAIFEAIADEMPNLVMEDRIISRGPRKGMRAIAFWNLSGEITEKTVARTLTGAADWTDFYKTVLEYSKPESMTMVVLDDTRSYKEPDQLGVTPYKKHWVRAFLTRPDHSHIHWYYRLQTQPCIYETQRAVDRFIEQYNLDREEILTWTGEKFNQWYFNQRKAA
jgi:hypothetical protein